MANSNKTGFLDKAAFHKAMDIISLAQKVRWRLPQVVQLNLACPAHAWQCCCGGA